MGILVWGMNTLTQPTSTSIPTLSIPVTNPSSTSLYKGLKTKALNITVNKASPY